MKTELLNKIMKSKSKFKETEIGTIPEDWEEYKLENLIDIKHGFAFQGSFFSNEPTKDILLTPGNFNIGGGFKDTKFKYYKGEYPPEYILKEDNIIISMTDLSKKGDTLGCPAKIPNSKDKRYLHNQRLGLVVFKSNKILNDFLYWLFRTKQYQNFIVNSATGSTVKHTSPSRIREYKFFASKKINEQRAIAKILSDLDEKIELNHQMNKTLEKTGQAIFKHWFVDFEFPNEKGKPYKSSGGEMMDSELGEIPKGWEIKTVEDIVTVKGGTTPSTKKSEYWEGGLINWCTPKDLSKVSFPVLLDTEKKITEEGLSTISSRLLPTGTLLLSSRAPIGYLAISDIPVAINQGFIAILCNKELSNYYMLFWVYSNMDEIKSRANGTTFQEINKANFRTIKIIVPPNNVLKDFNRIIGKLYSEIVNKEKESKSLSQTRDSLLPKLMSGKIRVGLNNEQ